MFVRSGRRADYPTLRSIFVQAFNTTDEAELWDHIVGADSSFKPEQMRVACEEERPVACTMVLPRQVRTRRGWVPGAVITLVACEPELQGKGYGGASVQDATTYMAEQGLAVGVLHGHATYYPRFGYAPVLPGYRVNIPLKSLTTDQVELRAATEADLPALAGLYAAAYDQNVCGVARSADPSFWHLRHPGQQELLVLPGLDGYAFVSVNPTGESLLVHEAAAASPEAGRRLLANLAGRATQVGRKKLALFLPPDHLLCRLGLTLADVEAHYSPATYAMAAVARWEPLLPEGYTCDGTALSYGDQVLLQADRLGLTQLVLGYRSIDDLLLAAPTARVADEAALARLQRDFPPLHPHWSLDPFWF